MHAEEVSENAPAFLKGGRVSGKIWRNLDPSDIS